MQYMTKEHTELIQDLQNLEILNGIIKYETYGGKPEKRVIYFLNMQILMNLNFLLSRLQCLNLNIRDCRGM